MRWVFGVVVFLALYSDWSDQSKQVIAELKALQPPALVVQPVDQAAIGAEIIATSEAIGLPPQLALRRFWRESRFRDGLVTANRGETSWNVGVAQSNSQFTPAVWTMTTRERIAEGVKHLYEDWQACGSHPEDGPGWACAERLYTHGH